MDGASKTTRVQNNYKTNASLPFGCGEIVGAKTLMAPVSYLRNKVKEGDSNFRPFDVKFYNYTHLGS